MTFQQKRKLRPPRGIKTVRFLAALTASAAVALPAASQHSDTASILIYDASGSMWGQLDGGATKVEVARKVIGDFFASRDNAAPLGVIAYGHNRRGDCADIQVIADVGVNNPSELSTRLNALNPRGMTPITESLSLAASMIPPTAEAADIILVTDGLETCEADPCALAAQLAQEGIAIRAHVVGFGLTPQEAAAMSCVADATGGLLLTPQSGQELADALNQISAVAPEFAPEPALPSVFNVHFTVSDNGEGTPRGMMEWSATSPEGEVIGLGTTQGTQQSLEGISVQLPGGDWKITAEGAEGRAERSLTISESGRSYHIPFAGAQFSVEIPPLGQVQAEMGARLPFTVISPGPGHLPGTPYKIIATGPEGSLTRDQVVRNDLITDRAPATYGGSTGGLEPGRYRLIIALTKNSGYEIIAERSFDAVTDPVVNIVGPDHAMPNETIELFFDGGYATHYFVNVVDENDRDLSSGNALYRGPGGGQGGPLGLGLKMPNREGRFDLVVRKDDKIIARKPIQIGGAPPKAEPQATPAQDAMPRVRASFRIPDTFPQIPLWWSAEPIDPDMSPEAWAPISEMVVAAGEFEPGRYRVSTTGPGEVEFRAEVEIFPGRDNNFIIPPVVESDDEASAETIGGPWQIIGVPPYQVQAGADQLLTLELEQAQPSGPISGIWVAGERLAGPQAAGREGTLTTVTLEDGTLRMKFTLGEPVPAPMSLFLTPYGIGYAGSLSSGAQGISVVMWPGDLAPPTLAEMREAVHGPAPADFVEMGAQEGSAPLPKAAAAMVPVRLRTPMEIGDVRVQWSAIRTDVQEMDVAFASHDLLPSFMTQLAAGGTYAVEGVNEAAGVWLAGSITVNPAGGNDFEIPIASPGASPEGGETFEDPVAYRCSDRAAGCAVTHRASGISLNLPNNWSMSEPYFYETAGGARASLPTATFFAEDLGTVISIELNPHQWMQANGPCRTIGENQLCMFSGQGMGADIGFEVIASSLQVGPAGGEVATAPQSETNRGAIHLTFRPTEQFGSACVLQVELSNPSGEAFTLFAPISATANGHPVTAVVDPDKPVVMVISAYTDFGGTLGAPMLSARCSPLVIGVGPVQCRMGIGDEGPLTDCPLPITLSADPEFADLFLIGGEGQANSTRPADLSSAATGQDGIIPIDLGDRDPGQVLRELFEKGKGN